MLEAMPQRRVKRPFLCTRPLPVRLARSAGGGGARPRHPPGPPFADPDRSSTLARQTGEISFRLRPIICLGVRCGGAGKRQTGDWQNGPGLGQGFARRVALPRRQWASPKTGRGEGRSAWKARQHVQASGRLGRVN
jgi:hypothetical protein